MFVYLFATIFSLFFAYLSQRATKHNKHLLISASVASTQVYGSPKQNDKWLPFRINKRVIAEKFFTFLSFFSLFLVSAIRYLVGTDYDGTYKAIYDYTYRDGYQFNLTGETLYGLLNQIASIYSGSDYVGVFALSSLLVCGFFFIGLKKQSVNFSYSVLLFIISGYYFWSFNAVRQMIAMSIFIYAFQYILNNQPWKYFVCIFFAAGFHTMALLYLPLYFLKRIKMSLKIILILLLVFVVSANSFREIAYLIASKIEIFNVYAIRYLDNVQFYTYTESSSSHMFINAAILILFILISQIYDRCQRKSNVWITIQFIALVFSSLSNDLPLANRISRLFAVTQILSIPAMTGLITDKTLRIIINFSIIACWIIYSVVTFYILGYHDVFPYQTIFDR